MANGAVPGVVKRIRAKKEGYFSVQRDFAFVAGRASYRVAARAQNDSIALVQGVAPDGGVFPLEKLRERDMSGLVPTTAGTPRGYLWRNSSLVFYPVPDSASYSYRLTYPRKVSQVVGVATAGVVSAGGITYPVDTTKVTLFLTAAASTYGFTTSTPLDIVRGRAPFDSLLDDATPVTISGQTVGLQPGAAAVAALRLSADSIGDGDPNGLYKGDYVCLAEQAPVLQLPTEAFYIIAQKVAIKLVARDSDLWKELNEELVAMETEFYGGLADRDPDQPEHVACQVWP